MMPSTITNAMNKRFSIEKRTDKIEIRVEPTLKELIGDIAFVEVVNATMDKFHSSFANNNV
jgi:hypothetical protein